jgi:hypothetical protein
MQVLIADKAPTPDHAGHDMDLPWSGFQTEAKGFVDYERAMLQRVWEKCKRHAPRGRRVLGQGHWRYND